MQRSDAMAAHAKIHRLPMTLFRGAATVREGIWRGGCPCLSATAALAFTFGPRNNEMKCDNISAVSIAQLSLHTECSHLTSGAWRVRLEK